MPKKKHKRHKFRCYICGGTYLQGNLVKVNDHEHGEKDTVVMICRESSCNSQDWFKSYSRVKKSEASHLHDELEQDLKEVLWTLKELVEEVEHFPTCVNEAKKLLRKQKSNAED